jgi:predicted Zn-dependent protease
LVLDPNLADASAAAGAIKYLYDWDWTGADACYQRALSLEPGNVGIMIRAAELAAIGNRFDQALRLNRRAVELDPLSASAYHSLAFVGWWAGRLDEAAAAGHKALELKPEKPVVHLLLSRIYGAAGRTEEALAEAQREKDPGWRLQGLALAYHSLARRQESEQALAELIAKHRLTSAFQIAEVYAYRAEIDSAFAWLERAYLQRDAGLSQMKGDPLLKNLVHDPRYAAFLKKMRLPS